MEPRPYGRGDTYLASSRRWDGSLQWSHGHTAVETLWHWSPIRHITRASMEPRPYGRGDIASGRRWPSKRQRFNGATAIRPWRPPSGHAGRRTSGGFNGATAIRPWRHYTRQGACKGRYLLQWSHGHTAVETLVHCVAHREVLRASMEPRPYGRGDTPAVDDERVAGKALQWSHGHTAVETAAQSGRSTQNMWASMEPRPYGRGDFVDWRAGQRRAFRFNGATAIRPWRLRGRPRRPTEFRRFNGATAIRPWRLR